MAPGSSQRRMAMTASAAAASVPPRNRGMNSERTMSTLIAFIAEMPAAAGSDPAADPLSTQCLDVARELFERLVTVFDCTEADARVALCFGWMQLTQCNHGLALALFGESDGCPEPPRIVIAVRSVIELDQSRSFDTTEYHPVGEALAIRCDHVEAPQTADTYVDLLGLDFKTGWSKPIRQMFRVGPSRKHDVAPRIYYPRENDFAIERPLRKRGVGGRGHDQSFDWDGHVTVVSMTLSNSRRSWPQRGAPRRLR